MQNNGPKPLKTAPKAIILHTLGVQVLHDYIHRIPKAPSMYIIPTLGPKGQLWATWSLRIMVI